MMVVPILTAVVVVPLAVAVVVEFTSLLIVPRWIQDGELRLDALGFRL